MIRHLIALVAVLFGVGVVSAVPAAAAGEHCPTGGYCLFSGTSYTGTSAVVPAGMGCHTVASLGFPVAHSAARGFGDGNVLQLYSDTACATLLGNVNSDVPSTAAASYRLIAIPHLAGDHCQVKGFCLFSFTGFTGLGRAVDTSPGCHPVMTLGFPQALSAARGIGAGGDLLLFADFNCHSLFDKLTTTDLPDTFAKGYQVVPVSS